MEYEHCPLEKQAKKTPPPKIELFCEFRRAGNRRSITESQSVLFRQDEFSAYEGPLSQTRIREWKMADIDDADVEKNS